MKFTKPSADSSKKNRASLKDKSKFKNKDVAAPNGKLQKGTKAALDLVKKGSFDSEIGTLVKGKANKSVPKKKEAKAVPEPAKLSPEVQLGLKLDKILEKKARNKPTQSTPTKPGKHVNALSPATPTDTLAKPKRKRKKGKKNSNNAETTGTDDTDPKGSTDGSLIASESPVPSKKGRKRKANKTETSSTEIKNLPQSNDPPTQQKLSKGAKRRKNNKVVDNVVQPPPTEQTDFNSQDFTLKSKDVIKAAKSVLDLYKKNTKSNMKLLDSEPEPIFLNFLFFLPHTKQKTIRFDLSHSLVRNTSDICLFVSDTARKNAEESKSQWEQALRDENVNNITEVIPLRSLVTEYKQYQDKRKLSDRFDFFLVDAKITHRVFGAVGSKFFHSRRRTPTPVQLKKGVMMENIKKALLKTVSHYSPAAETFTLQVGHTAMNEKEVEKNIVGVWEQFPQMFGVYWENIRRMSLLVPPHVPELPIFCSIKPPEGKPRVYKSMKWTKDSKVPVVGDLSTALDKKVLVYPSGDILVKSKKVKPEKSEGSPVKKTPLKEKKRLQRLKEKMKSESDEETDMEDDSEDEDEEDISTSGGSEEEDEELEQKKQPTLGGKKNSKEPTAVAGKKSKKKQKNVAEQEGEEMKEDIVDRAEEMYLRDLAAEKKLKKNNENPGKTSKLKGKKEVAQDSDDSDTDSDDASDDKNTNSLGNSWHDGDDSEDSSEDEQEEPLKKKFSKPTKVTENVKGNKRMNGANKPKNESQTSNKAQKNQKKFGAIKNSPPRHSNKKHLKKQSPSAKTQDVPSEKKTSGPSYQGVKTNNTKHKNKKQGRTVKNKIIAKKLVK